MFIQTLKKLTISESKEKITFFVLVSAFIGLGILYGLFLGSTVSNVSRISAIKHNLVAMNSELSELEFDYMKYKNLFTLEYSHKIGLSEVQSLSYVTRGSVDTALTFVE